jgi:hypothetical protein
MDGVVTGLKPRVGIPLLAGIWYAALFVLGAGLILYASPWGIGVRVDSLSYLTAADSLAQGRCLCWLGSGLQLKPLVHFGPAYPTLVAMASGLVGDTIAAARWVGAVLYGFNLVAAGGAVHLLSRRFWAGGLATFLVGASPVIIEAHDSAMSEPLFLLFTVAALGSLAWHLRGGRRSSLFLAVAFSGLAILTRYAGWSLILAGSVGILVLSSEPRRRAIRDAALFGIGASVPIGLWVLRNLTVAGTATNRVFGNHVVTADDGRKFLDVVTAWVTTAKPSHWLEGAGLLIIVAAMVWLLGRQSRSPDNPRSAAAVFGLLWLIFAAVYVPSLAFSRSFFDAKIPIDDRMLSPLYVALAIAVVLVIWVTLPRSRWLWPEVVASFVLVAGLGPRMVSGSVQVLSHLRAQGVGFTNRAWQTSDSLDWVRGLSPEATLYSNKALVIELLLGRAAYQVPERYDEVKALPRTDFEDGLASMRQVLQQPNSYLLYFDPDKPVAGRIEDEFTVGLVPVLTTQDGIVFAWKADASVP